MRKTFALVAAAACSSLVALSPASAARPQVFSLLEVSGPNRNLGPGNTFDQNGPPTLGGRFAFTNTMYRWAGHKRGARVGRLEAYCTIVKLDLAAQGATVSCLGTFFLPAGQIEAAGTLVFRQNGGSTFRLPIIGGAGAYAGARGYIKSTNLGSSDNSNDEFHLLP